MQIIKFTRRFHPSWARIDNTRYLSETNMIFIMKLQNNIDVTIDGCLFLLDVFSDHLSHDNAITQEI